MTNNIGLEDARYYSNHGEGPLVARVLSLADGKVHLERWNVNSARPKKTKFALPTEFFFASPACGLVKQSH